MNEKIKRRIELVKKGHKGDEIEVILLREQQEKEEKEIEEKAKKEIEEMDKQIEQQPKKPKQPASVEFAKTAVIKQPFRIKNYKDRIDESIKTLMDELILDEKVDIGWFKINILRVSKKHILLIIYGYGQFK